MRRLTAKTRAPRRVAGWALRRRSWMLGLLPLCYAGLSLLLSWRATIPAVIMVGYAVWLGLWAGRARHWGLVGVAAIYAGLAGAVWLGSSSAANPALLAPLWPRSLEMALVGIPGLAFWVMCAWAIGHRRWRMLNWLLGASVVAALLAANRREEAARAARRAWAEDAPGDAAAEALLLAAWLGARLGRVVRLRHEPAGEVELVEVDGREARPAEPMRFG